jgi:hypothetical protein
VPAVRSSTARFLSVDPVPVAIATPRLSGKPEYQSDLVGEARFVWGDITGTWYFNKAETRTIAWTIGFVWSDVRNPRLRGLFMVVAMIYSVWAFFQAAYDASNGWCLEVKAPSGYPQGYGSRKKGCT